MLTIWKRVIIMKRKKLLIIEEIISVNMVDKDLNAKIVEEVVFVSMVE